MTTKRKTGLPTAVVQVYLLISVRQEKSWFRSKKLQEWPITSIWAHVVFLSFFHGMQLMFGSVRNSYMRVQFGVRARKAVQNGVYATTPVIIWLDDRFLLWQTHYYYYTLHDRNRNTYIVFFVTPRVQLWGDDKSESCYYIKFSTELLVSFARIFPSLSFAFWPTNIVAALN